MRFRMKLRLVNTLLKDYKSRKPEEIRRLRLEGKITIFDFILMLPVGLLPCLGPVFIEAGICKIGSSGSFENRGIRFFVDLSSGFMIKTVDSSIVSNTNIRERKFSCWTTEDDVRYEFNGRRLTSKETHMPLINILCLSS